MNETLFNTMNINSSTVISTYSLSFTSEVIHRSILLIYISFGLIGNILNIFLFTCPVLSRTSSSLYLLSTSMTNLLVIMFVLPFRLFADGFNLDITSNSLIACKLVSYIYYVCLALPPFFTVLACADRWAASCVQVNRRRFARIHIAKRCIPLTIILCCLLYSFIPAIFTLDPAPPPPFCSFDDYYAIFALSFYLIIYSLIPSFLMGLFSIWLILNVRRKRDRVMPVVQVINTSAGGGMIRRDRRRLNQMQVMLVYQSITEFIFTLPYSIINLASITVNNNEYFLTIYSLLRLFIFFNYASSFYIYILSSKLYRDEFKKLVQRFFNRR